MSKIGKERSRAPSTPVRPFIVEAGRTIPAPTVDNQKLAPFLGKERPRAPARAWNIGARNCDEITKFYTSVNETGVTRSSKTMAVVVSVAIMVDTTSSVTVLNRVVVSMDADEADGRRVLRWRLKTALKKLAKGFCPWLRPRTLAMSSRPRIDFISVLGVACKETETRRTARLGSYAARLDGRRRRSARQVVMLLCRAGHGVLSLVLQEGRSLDGGAGGERKTEYSERKKKIPTRPYPPFHTAAAGTICLTGRRRRRVYTLAIYGVKRKTKKGHFSGSQEQSRAIRVPLVYVVCLVSAVVERKKKFLTLCRSEPRSFRPSGQGEDTWSTI